MKKIIFFSKNLGIGGMEKALINLLNKLVDTYEITLVLEEKKGEFLPLLSERIIVKEYKLSNNNIVLLRKALNFTKRIIWGIKNKNKYDFSCSYATYSVICSRLALIASKNSSLYVHSDYYNYYNTNEERAKQFFDSLRIDSFKNVIFVSNEAKNNMLKIYPNYVNNFLVINNIFDYSKYKKELTNNKNNIFLFLGRLDDSSKKLKRMFDAMKLAKEDNKNYKLWIVGDGPSKEDYYNYVKECDLEDNITFYSSTNDVSKYLNRCNYVILSSDYEGFPVLFLEAIYFEKPIVSTINVSDGMIDISNFGVITEKNSKELKKGMDKIIKSKIDMKFDFNKYNSEILNKIIRIIEEK